MTPTSLVNAISLRKNGIDKNTLADEIYDAYVSEMDKKGVMDFDDILIKALEKDIETPYLLVDEVQDINEMQYRLIKKWSEKAKSIFVIGDPDQSIYGFRGADSRCFERFEDDFAPVRVIRLTENYRSTPEIIDCSSDVMGGKTKLSPNRKNGEKI